MNGWRRGSLLVAGSVLAVAACSNVRYWADYDPQAAFGDYRTYAWLPATDDQQAALEWVSPFLERRLQRAIERELASRGFARTSDGNPDFLVSVYPVVPEREGEPGDDSAAAQAQRTQHWPRTTVSLGFAVGFGYPYWYGYPYWGLRYPYFSYYPPLRIGYPYYGYPYYGYPYYRYPSYGFMYPYFVAPGYGWYPPYGVVYTPVFGHRHVFPEGVEPGTLVADVVDAGSGELVWRGWAARALLETPDAEHLDAYVESVVAKMLEPFPPLTPGR
jgi:hypothetical protein